MHAFGDTPGYGRSRKNHKYIAKVGKWPNARYFYTWQEYQRYKHKGNHPVSADQERYEEQKRTTQKAQDFKQRTKVSDKVSAKDYLLGGSYRKDLKNAKKKLNSINKQLERDQKKSERLLKKIRSIESKKNYMDTDKAKLSSLRKQRNEVNARIASNMQAGLDQKREVTIALVRYEKATLVGQISKKAKDKSSKASELFEKYKKKAISKINSPVIKIKKG